MDLDAKPVYDKGSRLERRGASRRSVIDLAKERVPVIDLADLLCGPGKLRRVGNKWVGQCPIPDHEDKTPSFTCYPETNSWWCFGCQRGRDVVDLASHVWGIDNPATAAGETLLTFGHEVPPRPSAWFRKFERQKPVRDAIGRARFDHLRRRLFRTFFAPSLNRIEDLEEREAEARILWEAAGLLTRMMVERLGKAGGDG